MSLFAEAWACRTGPFLLEHQNPTFEIGILTSVIWVEVFEERKDLQDSDFRLYMIWRAVKMRKQARIRIGLRKPIH